MLRSFPIPNLVKSCEDASHIDGKGVAVSKWIEAVPMENTATISIPAGSNSPPASCWSEPFAFNPQTSMLGTVLSSLPTSRYVLQCEDPNICIPPPPNAANNNLNMNLAVAQGNTQSSRDTVANQAAMIQALKCQLYIALHSLEQQKEQITSLNSELDREREYRTRIATLRAMYQNTAKKRANLGENRLDTVRENEPLSGTRKKLKAIHTQVVDTATKTSGAVVETTEPDAATPLMTDVQQPFVFNGSSEEDLWHSVFIKKFMPLLEIPDVYQRRLLAATIQSGDPEVVACLTQLQRRYGQLQLSPDARWTEQLWQTQVRLNLLRMAGVHI